MISFLHHWLTFQWPSTEEDIHKGKISPILIQCMHCVSQHFVSVQYSFPQEFKWPHSSFWNSKHHPSSSRPTTTTSNAYSLSIYSLFLSSSLQPNCAESLHDATRRNFDAHKYTVQIVPHKNSVLWLPSHGTVFRVTINDWRKSLNLASTWRQLRPLTAFALQQTLGSDVLGALHMLGTKDFKNTSPRTSRRSWPSLWSVILGKTSHLSSLTKSLTRHPWS